MYVHLDPLNPMHKPMLAHQGHSATAQISLNAHSVSGVQQDMPAFEVYIHVYSAGVYFKKHHLMFHKISISEYSYDV